MAIHMSNKELKKLGINVPETESKYKSQKRELDSKKFDSQKEANRYCELVILQKAGIISDLQEQVTFELIPKQYDASGKLIEKACKYKADFVYTQNGKTIVEDTKGVKTTEYKIKKKLMLYRYGIRIIET